MAKNRLHILSMYYAPDTVQGGVLELFHLCLLGTLWRKLVSLVLQMKKQTHKVQCSFTWILIKMNSGEVRVRGGGDVMMEAEIGWCILKIQEEARRQRILMSTRRLEEEKEWILPGDSRRNQPCSTLALAQWNWLWISCLQNRRISYYICYNSNRKLIHFLAPYGFLSLKKYLQSQHVLLGESKL